MKEWTARIARSKTMIFAILLAASGALQASLGLFSTLLTPEVYGVFAIAIGVIVAVLRVITTEPLKNK